MNANERESITSVSQAEHIGQEDDLLAGLVKDAAASIVVYGLRGRITLVADKGRQPPRGFPRGELLCENSDGRLARSYSALAVLNFVARISREGKA